MTLNVKDHSCLTHSNMADISELSENVFSVSGRSSDPDYVPSSPTHHKTDTENMNKVSRQDENDYNQSNRIKRKRIAQPDKQKKNVRKMKRMKGEEYVSVSGKIVPAKILNPDKVCGCKNKCNSKITSDRRIQIHRNFYSLSWGLKNAFIMGTVEVVNKKRKYTKRDDSRRHLTRIYKLNNGSEDVVICKTYYKDTLMICDGSISNALGRKHVEGTPLEDKRGRHEPANKSKPTDIFYLREFITTFPTYESHYSRKDNHNRKYLPPDLNMNIMYKLYTEKCESNSKSPLSLYVFRHVFNTQFNLHFHRPQTDTCQKSDRFNAELQSKSITDERRNSLTIEKELHQHKAQAAHSLKKQDIITAQKDATKRVLTFDLQKTLPTPVLSTGVTYYKRQMWTYNLGVHDENSSKAFMYMWAENEASRGTQEVASCLLKHIDNHVPDSVKHLTLYSDGCGGQNRNIKMVLMLTDILQKSKTLVTIDHKFFISGHSFNSCDHDFALIEKTKKYFPNIFIPDDWVSMVKKCRKSKPTFEVTRMQANNFFSSGKLETFITNRKKFIEGNKVEWLKTVWIRLEKNKPLIVKMKQDYVEESPFYELDLWPRKKGRHAYPFENLDLLYPNGRELTKEKLDHLIFLTRYIPPIHHNFYENLRGHPEAIDTLENPDVNNMPSESDLSECKNWKMENFERIFFKFLSSIH